MTDELKRKRGQIVVVRDSFFEMDTDALKVLFSHFFPIAIENNHDFGFYNRLTYYGYSEQFREVPEGEKAPEYDVIIDFSDNKIQFTEKK